MFMPGGEKMQLLFIQTAVSNTASLSLVEQITDDLFCLEGLILITLLIL